MRHPITYLFVFVAYNSLYAQTYDVAPWKNNTRYNEFAAVAYNGGLVYCSDKPFRFGVTWLDEEGRHPTKIYFSAPDKSNQLFSEKLVTRFNEGPACFDKNGTMMAYTGTLRFGNNASENKLGLYFSEYSSSGWSVPHAFIHNSPDTTYSVAHPALSADGQKLYFASDMPGGFGGKDIYMCNKMRMGWGPPINLGPAVNSEHNEIFPSIDEKGNLYFSSSRNTHTGMDIFKADYSDGAFRSAQCLPSPVNSDRDDFALSIAGDGMSGYFTTNRDGRNDDIYTFTLNYPQFEGCPQAELPTFCYLFEEMNIVPNDSLPLTYEWEFGDGSTGSGLASEHCYADYGQYHVALNVYNPLTRQKFARVSELDLAIERSPFPYIHSADKVLTQEPALFSDKGTDIENFEASEYYWEFGDGSYAKGKEVTHQWMKPGVYRVQLGIIGRSTKDGSEQRRCATKQISVGTTEELAILADTSAYSSSRYSSLQADMILNETDSTQQLKYKPDSLLYFVEFKSSHDPMSLSDPYFANIKYEITERYEEQEATYKYSVGGTSEMQVLVRIYNDLLAKGYNESLVREEKIDAFSFATTKKWWYIPDSLATAINNHLNKFNDIRFDRDEYEIQTSSYDNLDYIAQVMILEPELKLRIMAYTDSTGSSEHNYQLSLLRAEAVAHYLEMKGVDSTRLIPEGFGEKNPLKSNAHEEGRAANRRVSFQIALDTRQVNHKKKP